MPHTTRARQRMRWSLKLLFVVFASAGLELAQAAAPQAQRQPEPANTAQAADFSDAVVNTVLSDIRDGLEGHSQRLMLSAFDPEKMDGYLVFKDQIQAFFDTYETFRVHYRLAQSTTEGPRGIVLVDFELEETPRRGNAPPQRKSAQLRFELERGTKGWKIVDLAPRGFFS